MKDLRRVVGKFKRDRIRNERTRDERQLEWFGCISRGRKNKIKRVMEIRVEGKMRRKNKD